MKYLKPLMVVIAGFAIAMLVSFKSEVPKKEYATVNYFEASNKDAIQITIGSETKTITPNPEPNEVFFVKTLNDLLKEGWEIKSTDCFQRGTGLRRIIYLERTKQ